ncbi:MAG: hypothetical protein WD904_00360 [Dehalococcoidia bacterium]
MERFDVIICPAAEEPAGPLANITEQNYIYTLPYGLTGAPSSSSAPEHQVTVCRLACRSSRVPGAMTSRWRSRNESSPCSVAGRHRRSS